MIDNLSKKILKELYDDGPMYFEELIRLFFDYYSLELVVSSIIKLLDVGFILSQNGKYFISESGVMSLVTEGLIDKKVKR